MMSGPLNSHVGEKVSLDLYLTPHTDINSRWIADLNVKGQIFQRKTGYGLRELGGGRLLK